METSIREHSLPYVTLSLYHFWILVSAHDGSIGLVALGDPLTKPRWDVHLPGSRNRAGGLAGVLRLLIAGPSGTAASRHLSGWPARRESCRPSLSPGTWFPSTDSQTASSALKSGLKPSRFTSPRFRPGIRRYSRTASPLLSSPKGRRSVAPNDVQRPGMPWSQLSQEHRRRF